MRSVLSFVTPATTATLPALTVASTTAADPSRLLSRFDGLAQRLGVGAVNLRREHLEPVDIDRLRGKIVTARRRDPDLQAIEVPLQLAAAREHGLDSIRHRLRVGLHAARDARNPILHRMHPGERLFARERHDSAHPGRDSALGDDLEQAHVSRA